MNEMKCYVLTCNCYSGDDSVSVYWNEDDAYKAMIDELSVKIINLENSGYNVAITEDDVGAELYVPDGNIYFDWNIAKTTIR